MRIWIASADTRNFSWLATGFTRRHARAALMAAWRVHVHRTGADRGYLTDDSINTFPVVVGEGLRDGTVLAWVPSPLCPASALRDLMAGEGGEPGDSPAQRRAWRRAARAVKSSL